MKLPKIITWMSILLINFNQFKVTTTAGMSQLECFRIYPDIDWHYESQNFIYKLRKQKLTGQETDADEQNEKHLSW